MDYYSKITILKKYYNEYTNNKNSKDAAKILNQIKNLHGKIIENILELKDSKEENKLEVLSDLERLNYKIIKIIDECETNNVEELEELGDIGDIGDTRDTHDTREETVQSKRLNKELNSLVFFYAEWCGHCKNFMPTWDALSQMVPSDIINMVKISCVKKQKECNAIKEIKGYPTIMFIDMKENKTTTYAGQRNPESIIQFINQCMGKQVLQLE